MKFAAKPGAISLVLVTLAACNGGPSGGPVLPPGNVACTTPAVVDLAVGEGVVLAPSASGNCLQIPAPATGTSRHIVVTVATDGEELTNGVKSAYSVTGAPAASGSASVADDFEPPPPVIGGFGRHFSADEFHHRIRQWDHQISEDMGTRLLAASPPAGPKPVPVLGTVDSFFVCANADCNNFVKVGATTMYVGSRSAIYLDNASPAGGFTQADINQVGELFENQTYGLHKTDTTAFGAESDLDGNGVVKVLLTPRVNRLTTDCSTSIIVGFFLGLDLTSQQGSNQGEVFYHLVPDPNNANCPVTKSFASTLLPVTFIHEFQHMISFNQHVILRDGLSELTWLNEGLSHYAEELGGRVIDNSECQNANCFSQFTSDNFNDAYKYLNNPEASFLIEPGSSGGTLAERGANWLFVRWYLDQFATTLPLGTDMTRKLEQTTAIGFNNVAAQSGVDFSTLVTQWQLANYLAGDTTLVQAAGSRFQYTSWDLRHIYTINSFDKPYPLTPPVVTTSFTHSGTLRGGSGVHYIVQRSATDTAFNFKLQITDPSVLPRFGVVRIQ